MENLEYMDDPFKKDSSGYMLADRSNRQNPALPFYLGSDGSAQDNIQVLGIQNYPLFPG